MVPGGTSCSWPLVELALGFLWAVLTGNMLFTLWQKAQTCVFTFMKWLSRAALTSGKFGRAPGGLTLWSPPHSAPVGAHSCPRHWPAPRTSEFQLPDGYRIIPPSRAHALLEPGAAAASWHRTVCPHSPRFLTVSPEQSPCAPHAAPWGTLHITLCRETLLDCPGAH